LAVQINNFVLQACPCVAIAIRDKRKQHKAYLSFNRLETIDTFVDSLLEDDTLLVRISAESKRGGLTNRQAKQSSSACQNLTASGRGVKKTIK